MTTPSDDLEMLSRWRLVLGKDAEKHGISLQSGSGDSGSGSGLDELQRIEELVGFLFEEGTDPNGQSMSAPAKDREGGPGASQMTVPLWVDSVSELFPHEVKEVMQKELVRRRGLSELLEKPELLEKIEPNKELVKTLLIHKDLLNPKARVLARKIIQKVIDQLKDKMKIQVEAAITGALRRDRHSPRRVYRNLDLKTTVKRNLKNYDNETSKLHVERLYFFASERKQKPWHIIVNVDQSGSMLDSAIFSAVMASIFHGMPSVRTSLILFDTQIVDLSNKVGEPVDVLLSINLGGGTDITQSLQYANQLVREPGRTIVVTISDFYEGRPESELVDQVRMMFDSGIRMVGLGALGFDARPEYNKATAKKLRKAGMDILVCTPERLAETIGRIIRG
ncbi:MAG: VWA domain-containing protein [Candidatus Melainabacteria bacterium]|mgnify:CR=1 FL=1|nr:VWA domain-containing protein [Candidatus Melainabacteria bacterium]